MTIFSNKRVNKAINKKLLFSISQANFNAILTMIYWNTWGILESGSDKVYFGNNVWIGPNVGFYSPEHAFDHEERTAGYERSLPITVGDNVWICGGVTIIGSLTIGANSVIGAGAVVVKDVPSGVLVVGNPARVIRQITEKDRLGLISHQ